MSHKDKEQVEEPLNRFDTPKEPRKSLATYLRNQNKLYVNSFNIIDRKSAILIKLNASIISAVLIFFESVRDLKNGRIIGLMMVLFCFVSLIYAINASRPRTFQLLKLFRKALGNKYNNLEERIYPTGLHYTDGVSLDEYEEAFDKLVNRQDLQIGTQVRTMYLFEEQIKRSFRNIEISYLVFLVGFLVVITIFILENIVDKIF